MDKENIQEKLKKIVSPYVQNAAGFENFNAETDFLNDLQINSAHLVDIVLDVEDAFDVEIDNDAMNQMLSVNETVKVIQQKLEAK